MIKEKAKSFLVPDFVGLDPGTVLFDGISGIGLKKLVIFTMTLYAQHYIIYKHIVWYHCHLHINGSPLYLLYSQLASLIYLHRNLLRSILLLHPNDTHHNSKKLSYDNANASLSVLQTNSLIFQQGNLVFIFI